MKKAALVILVLAIAAIAVAYFAAIVTGGPQTWTAWVMAIATSCAMVAMLALGAARDGASGRGLRRLAVTFAVVLLILIGAFAAALLLPAAGEPLLLGLPRRAGIVLYGIGLLPALVLPLTYALTFDDDLTDDDVERVRASARAHEHGA